MMIRELATGIFSTLVLAACATSPSHPAGRTASAVPPPGCSTVESRASGAAASGCYSPTRVYSGKQLQATGKTDVGHALQLLDPSITVHGN